MGCVGHVECMWETRNALKSLVEKNVKEENISENQA
jgi:hypothetical protein